MATTIYTLDASILKTDTVKISIDTLYTEDDLIKTSSGSQTTTLGFVTASNGYEKNQAQNNINTVEWEIPAQSNDTYTYYKTVSSTSYQVLTINYKKGQITFYIDIRTPIDTLDNVTIEFSADTELASNDVFNCSFGYQFGAEGTEDRLWLSGNPNKPNYLYYSSMDDFSYFPVNNYKKLPSSANEIVAFSRLSDNTLAVHSKTDGTSPTIYYITPRQMELDGEHTRYEFPMIEGIIGEYPLSSKTAHALMGDSIYLSKNGVFGVHLGTNITSIERYEYLRSRYVNKKLLAEPNLENAIAIVYGNRYYLAVNNHVYIADARWKVSPEQSDETNFEYEWWYWEDVPVKQWLILGDELHFLDNSNQLCVIDDKFTDRTIYPQINLVSSGDLTIDTTTGITTYNSAMKLANEDTFYIQAGLSYDMGFLPMSVSFDDESETITITLANTNDLLEFGVGKMYYADGYNSSNEKVTTLGLFGEIVSIDTLTNSFVLDPTLLTTNYYTSMKAEYNSEYSYKWLENLNDTTCYIAALDTENNTFKLKRYSDSVKTMGLVTTAGVVSSYKNVTITHYEPIKCKWMTPALSFGYLLYAKNLYGVSIVLDPSVEGLVNFGYTTARTTREQGDVVSLANEKELVTRERLSEYALYNFDFNNIDFTNFSFEAGAFACSRNIKLRVRNFTFIMFKFENNTKGNFAMNSFQLLYDIGKRNKGVR